MYNAEHIELKSVFKKVRKPSAKQKLFEVWKSYFWLVKNGIIPFSAVSVVSPFGGDFFPEILKEKIALKKHWSTWWA